MKLAATGRGILAFLVYAAVWEGYHVIQPPFPVTPWEIRNHQEIRLMQKGEDGGRHGPRHTKIRTAIRLLESLGSEDGVSVAELSKKMKFPRQGDGKPRMTFYSSTMISQELTMKLSNFTIAGQVRHIASSLAVCNLKRSRSFSLQGS